MSTPAKFIQDTKKKAKENGIKIRMINKRNVYARGDTMACAGYFDEEDMEIGISSVGDESFYYSLLAHESSHMDQFIHDKYLWEKHKPGYEIFFEWLSDRSIIKQEILLETVQDIIRIELDCEYRTIAKIKKYNLPVYIPYYIQTTNAYLYGHLYSLEKRKWLNDIMEDDNVIKRCSTKLKKEYTHIPQRVYRAMNKKFKTL